MRQSFLLLVCLFAVCTLNGQSTEKKPLIVMVQYTAQPGKGSEAVAALQQLLTEVKKEPHYIGIRLLVSPADPASILLYEQWADGDYYRGAHMQTEHLQAFIASSRAFLAGPPQISFWQAAE